MAVKLQIRRGTSLEWSEYNPILMEGELGLELDTDKWKIGNGLDDWSTRPYVTQGIPGEKGEKGDTPEITNQIIVDALGYVPEDQLNVGKLEELNTDSKLNVVAAINDVNQQLNDMATSIANRTRGNVFTSRSQINALYGTNLTATSKISDVLKSINPGDSLSNLYLEGSSNYPGSFNKISCGAKAPGLTVWNQVYNNTTKKLYYCVLENIDSHTVTEWREVATTDKIDVLCTPLPGYKITEQNNYILNGVAYINTFVEKIDGTVLTNNSDVITLPLGVRPERTLAIATALRTIGIGYYVGSNAILSTTGMVRILISSEQGKQIHLTGDFIVGG